MEEVFTAASTRFLPLQGQSACLSVTCIAVHFAGDIKPSVDTNNECQVGSQWSCFSMALHNLQPYKIIVWLKRIAVPQVFIHERCSSFKYYSKLEMIKNVSINIIVICAQLFIKWCVCVRKAAYFLQ